MPNSNRLQTGLGESPKRIADFSAITYTKRGLAPQGTTVPPYWLSGNIKAFKLETGDPPVYIPISVIVNVQNTETYNQSTHELIAVEMNNAEY